MGLSFISDGTMVDINITASYSVNDRKGHRTIYNNDKVVWTERGHIDIDSFWNGKVLKVDQHNTIEVDATGYRKKYLAKMDYVFGKNYQERYFGKPTHRIPPSPVHYEESDIREAVVNGILMKVLPLENVYPNFPNNVEAECGERGVDICGSCTMISLV
jgi:hypothetical protein